MLVKHSSSIDYACCRNLSVRTLKKIQFLDSMDCFFKCTLYFWLGLMMCRFLKSLRREIPSCPLSTCCVRSAALSVCPLQEWALCLQCETCFHGAVVKGKSWLRCAAFWLMSTVFFAISRPNCITVENSAADEKKKSLQLSYALIVAGGP